MWADLQRRTAASQLHWAQGLGNRFWVFDLREAASDWPANSAELARQLCLVEPAPRGPGEFRADGLVLVGPGDNGAAASMQIYNADGSRAQMCGNALRCLSLLVAARGDEVFVDSDAGRHAVCALSERSARVSMGKPTWMRPSLDSAGSSGALGTQVTLEVLGRSVTGRAVSIGNPHFVLEQDSIEEAAIEELGPALSTHPSFPEGANIEFCFEHPQGIRVRVWERGVGETQACGTGACAVAWAHVLAQGGVNAMQILMPGGPLTVGKRGDELSLTGGAELQHVLAIEGQALVFEASHSSRS